MRFLGARYFTLSYELSKIWKTLGHALRQLLMFLVLEAVLFMGFAVCAWAIFGPKLPQYNSLAKACIAMLRPVPWRMVSYSTVRYSITT